MRTLVCVPIFIESPGDPALGDPIDAALVEAELARAKGADLVEFRIDRYFSGSTDSGTPALRAGSSLPEPGTVLPEPGTVLPEPGTECRSTPDTIAQLQRLLAESPLPVILTCRPTWEGGDYDGDDADRVALFEHLCCDTDSPPAYLDVELAAYTRSANLRQKINLCVKHPKQTRDVSTRLILSTHDFEGRPADLGRRLLAIYDEPACAVVKVAYRARSLRDNLDLFEILRESPKPTIALGMGEFGLMSRVLAPKFNGFLTFASLRDEAATAPGQPTIDDLLGMYRFRKIGKATKLYGVIGWPVGHSLSPLVHNAGFAEIGWDGVYLPLPVAADEKDAEASYTSFKVTVNALFDDGSLDFGGASVTIPHKENLARLGQASGWMPPTCTRFIGAMNTVYANLGFELGSSFDRVPQDAWPIVVVNTDSRAIERLLDSEVRFPDKDSEDPRRFTAAIVGAGGVGKAAAFTAAGLADHVAIVNRNLGRAESLRGVILAELPSLVDRVSAHELEAELPSADVYINCTPVGMTGGPDPDGLSIPIPDMISIDENTVFFDTVYNPVETPMLKAARARGCRTIDGVEMFVKQAAAQFELWTGQPAPVELFDRLCRERLGS